MLATRQPHALIAQGSAVLDQVTLICIRLGCGFAEMARRFIQQPFGFGSVAKSLPRVR